jgi:hypothetical protein
MSVVTDRVKAVLDNMKGSTFTNARALEIVEKFNNSTEGTADEKATLFMDTLVRIVKQTVKSHAQQAAAAANEAAEQQAGDDAVTDL